MSFLISYELILGFERRQDAGHLEANPHGDRQEFCPLARFAVVTLATRPHLGLFPVPNCEM